MSLQWVRVVILGLTTTMAAAQASKTDSEMPTFTPTGPMKITHSVRIAPGAYRIPVVDGSAVIEIDADNVLLDLTGVTIESGTAQPWERVGVGIHSKSHSHITIKGGIVKGYRFNVFLDGEAGQGSDINISEVDVSGSRAQRLLSTETHYDENDWANIFDLDAWESYGAGLYVKNLTDISIEHVQAHAAQNGIMVARSTHATIYHSDVSHNSGWGIALYESSENDLLGNHADWNVRCEGKTYSAGCDSSGILLMEGSNRNRIVGNSFTHSGDGFFLSKSAVGNPSNFNYVAFNDGSFSFHNSFEAVFTAGNQFFHNIADHSDYGFWLSFSRDTTVTDNHVEGSKHDGIAIEHGEMNIFVHNQISSNAGSGIRLFCSGNAPEPSRRYTIINNTFTKNKAPILVNRTGEVTIEDNEFIDNNEGIRLDAAGPGIRSARNKYSPAQQGDR